MKSLGSKNENEKEEHIIRNLNKKYYFKEIEKRQIPNNISKNLLNVQGIIILFYIFPNHFFFVAWTFNRAWIPFHFLINPHELIYLLLVFIFGLIRNSSSIGSRILKPRD